MFKQLVEWSTQNYSYLPWRVNRSLYNTLVSEIMLQQTTVSTVINHFDSFIKKYPTIESLAAISEDQILKDWKGLGYYRRARNLLGAAKQIQSEFQGAIPTDLEQLKSIKGIGDYTANAIIAMGANERGLCVDANLERVLSRVYDIQNFKGPQLQKKIYKLFNDREICNEQSELGARVYNEALMDLGRSICKARSVSCELCPLKSICKTFGKNPLSYPKLKDLDKKQKIFELDLLRVIVLKQDKILAYKKNEKQWLTNQYEIPTFILHSEDQSLVQYPHIVGEHFYNLPTFKSGITKYKITNYVLYGDQKDLKELNKSFELYDFEGLNLSTASLKSLKL